jgi:hypothetical protein
MSFCLTLSSVLQVASGLLWFWSIVLIVLAVEELILREDDRDKYSP